MQQKMRHQSSGFHTFTTHLRVCFSTPASPLAAGLDGKVHNCGPCMCCSSAYQLQLLVCGKDVHVLLCLMASAHTGAPEQPRELCTHTRQDKGAFPCKVRLEATASVLLLPHIIEGCGMCRREGSFVASWKVQSHMPALRISAQLNTGCVLIAHVQDCRPHQKGLLYPGGAICCGETQIAKCPRLWE